MMRSRLVSIGATVVKGALRPSALPRAASLLPRLSSSSSSSAASFSTLSRPSLFRSSLPTFSRAYSSESSKALADILKEEKEFEAENPLDDTEIKEYLKSSPFKLNDVSRKMEVTMTRKFGNETVTIFFTVEAKPSDDLFGNEELEKEEGEEAGEEEEEEALPSQPPFFSVLVSKPSGTVTFNCTAEPGHITINQVVFTGDSKLAIEDSAQADYDRTNVYPGPNLEDLDERLQDALYDFLLERIGDEEALSNFIPAYIEFKEQKEYENWLGDIEKFARS